MDRYDAFGLPGSAPATVNSHNHCNYRTDTHVHPIAHVYSVPNSGPSGAR